jgi:hypothetical protein
MLRELAALLAEEGLHLDERGEFSDVDVPDLQTLQRALNRAVERQNLALFTPTGQARERAAALRQVIEALAAGDTARRRGRARAGRTRVARPHPRDRRRVHRDRAGTAG